MSSTVAAQPPVKLDQNENPLGMSPKAVAVFQEPGLHSVYPQNDTYPDVRTLLGVRCGIDPDSIVLGHGSNELISLACQYFLRSGDEAVMGRPTFSLFRRFTAAQHAIPVEVPLRDGVHDITAMLAAITPKTKMLFVCDPNNPTGTVLQTEQWLQLLAGIPDSVLLLIDQAYSDYMQERYIDAAEIVRGRPNTLVLRTLSKLYGLASIRFGYGFGDAATIAAIQSVRVPYNVSKPAAFAAKAALTDGEFVERSLRINREGRAFLRAAFEELGLHVFPSEANFLSIAIPISGDRARTEFIERGIFVRSGDALSMPGRIRISIGTREQNEAFIAALRELLPGWQA